MRLHCQIFNNLSIISVLEVYQFARDAAVAEAWLIAQEPYLMANELGVGVCFLIKAKLKCFLVLFS